MMNWMRKVRPAKWKSMRRRMMVGILSVYSSLGPENGSEQRALYGMEFAEFFCVLLLQIILE